MQIFNVGLNHILEARCVETDNTVIQLLLVRNQKRDVYEYWKLTGGEMVEYTSGLTYEQTKNRYDEVVISYKDNRQPTV